MSRQVIILGIHRCGSSCVAGVLQRLGVSLGYRLLRADKHNAPGYHEDLDFVNLNEFLIERWQNPVTTFRAGTGCLYAPFIRHRDADFPIWAIKDPRLCITLPLFISMLSQPRFVICRRPLNESISSMNNAYFKGQRRNAAERIQRFYAAHLQTRLSEQSQVPQHEVSFPQLLADPTQVVTQLAEFTFAGLASPTPQQIQSAIDFVAPEQAGHSQQR